MKDRKFGFLKLVSLVLANLGAISILLLLFASPLIVSTKLIKLERGQTLVLGATDVLDYGNLVRTETSDSQTKIIKIKYTAFPNKVTVYENVAYVKNQGQTQQKLSILSSLIDSEMFFNMGDGSRPKTIEIAPGQLILTSLVVSPASDNSAQEKETEFVIVSF